MNLQQQLAYCQPHQQRGMEMNPIITRVTQRIIARSAATRTAYLQRISAAKEHTVHRSQLACGNLAHGFAACQPEDKAALKIGCVAISPSLRPITICCLLINLMNITHNN